MVTHHSILLIEDSPGECELFRLALTQTGLDVALHTEQDAEAAFRFLEDRSHQSQSTSRYPLSEAAGVVSTARIERGPSQAARSASTETMPVALHSSISISIPEGGLNRSPTARVERGPSEAARSASTETMPATSPSLPTLILLDLNLRGQDGCDFLKRLRSDPRFATLPIVIFTTSDDQHDLARCYASGSNGYVVKPGIFAELVQCTGDICRYWIDQNRVSYKMETPC